MISINLCTMVLIGTYLTALFLSTVTVFNYVCNSSLYLFSTKFVQALLSWVPKLILLFSVCVCVCVLACVRAYVRV